MNYLLYLLIVKLPIILHFFYNSETQLTLFSFYWKITLSVNFFLFLILLCFERQFHGAYHFRLTVIFFWHVKGVQFTGFHFFCWQWWFLADLLLLIVVYKILSLKVFFLHFTIYPARGSQHFLKLWSIFFCSLWKINIHCLFR